MTMEGQTPAGMVAEVLISLTTREKLGGRIRSSGVALTIGLIVTRCRRVSAGWMNTLKRLPRRKDLSCKDAWSAGRAVHA